MWAVVRAAEKARILDLDQSAAAPGLAFEASAR
jgi:hypothetical protein